MLKENEAKKRDICTHEFSHAIHKYSLNDELKEKINRAYETAKAKGLWPGAYAMVNPSEFFAELSMWYFGSHGDFGDIRPKPTRGRMWLKRYDIDSYRLLKHIYSDNNAVNKISRVHLPNLLVNNDSRSFKSQSSLSKSSIIFRNDTTETYKLFWADYKGQRKPFGHLHPGTGRFQVTYVGHVWIITDSRGSIRKAVRANEKPSLVIFGQRKLENSR